MSLWSNSRVDPSHPGPLARIAVYYVDLLICQVLYDHTLSRTICQLSNMIDCPAQHFPLHVCDRRHMFFSINKIPSKKKEIINTLE